MNPFFSKTDKAAIEKVFTFIEKKVGITRQRFLKKSREKEIVQARYTAWYILKFHFKFSYSSIGEIFEKDHTTIMYGTKSVEENGIGKDILASFQLHLSTYPQP